MIAKTVVAGALLIVCAFEFAFAIWDYNKRKKK